MSGKNFINILSDEIVDEYEHRQITERFIKDYFRDPNRNIYVYGPPRMMEAIEKFLSNLHIDKNMIVT